MPLPGNQGTLGSINAGTLNLRKPRSGLPLHFLRPGRGFLLVKTKARQIVVLHQVVLHFEALLIRTLGQRLPSSLNEVVVADDFSPDESLLDIGVNRPPGPPGPPGLRRSA